jgi:LmbE family N-acetylglucosaminyl deacetylase
MYYLYKKPFVNGLFCNLYSIYFDALQNPFYMRSLVFACLFLLPFFTNAQHIDTYNSADILLQLKKLPICGSVLYVAAHPDDENNGLLPFLAKEKKYRTAYLSLTRGDGGQNLIGPEQGIELGLIRTHELLAARKQDGSEQYFTSAYEFGYSKSAEETFGIWDKNQILADVVWVIRKYKPDVIITRFPTDGRGGHGHHTASAIIAEEAFSVAADASKFPDQLKQGVSIWQAKRLVWNTFNFGGNNTTADNQFKIQVNNLNPLLGKSYGEIGAEARSMHKSQGEGRPRIRGNRIEYFTTIKGTVPTNDLLDDVNQTWNKILNAEDAAAVETQIQKIIASYTIENPAGIVKLLAELYQFVNTRIPIDRTWHEYKKQEIKKLIEACSGLVLEATTTVANAVEKDTVKVNILVTKRYDIPAILNEYRIDDKLTAVKANLATNVNYTNIATTAISSNYTTTQPYWLFQPIKKGRFTISNQNHVGDALNEPCINATFYINMYGVEIPFTKPVLYKYTDLVKGELYQPFVIIPAISLYLSPSIKLTQVYRDGKTISSNDSIQVIATSHITKPNTALSLMVLQEKQKPVFSNQLYNLEKDKQYIFQVPYKQFYNPKAMPFIEVALQTTINNYTKTYNEFLQTIQYDHIPTINYFFKDHIQFINELIAVKGKKVGYINGAGDLVADAIKQLGYTVDILQEKDITTENLQQYDAVVAGIRAYNIHAYLTNKYDVLMGYVQNGGNLIVQYLRNNFVGSKPIKVGPFGFVPTAQSRITNENAMVNFALPNHPFINTPNKLTNKDFEGWVQERSTYQAEQFDANYQAPFSMNDEGEKPTNGSIITTPFGKGNFTYVSMVLFRQLPNGNAGAYKLLANILSVGK